MTDAPQNTQDTPEKQRTNTPLYILLASFLIPAVLAYGYFFFGDRPSISSNGELITPVIDIETFKMSNQQGEIQDRESLTPKWRMYYFVNGHCDEACQNNLFNMRQINKALGKNQDRVQHVIVHLQQPDNDFMTLIASEHQNAIQLFSETTSINLQDSIVDLGNQNYIYLMDPLGNIMMRFSDELNPKLILKDINKLLKISRIG